MGQKIESNLSWRYVGGGVWEGTGVAVNHTLAKFGSLIGTSFTLRHAGNELLRKSVNTLVGVLTPEKSVFVRADDAAAVEEHLRRR